MVLYKPGHLWSSGTEVSSPIVFKIPITSTKKNFVNSKISATASLGIIKFYELIKNM